MQWRTLPNIAAGWNNRRLTKPPQELNVPGAIIGGVLGGGGGKTVTTVGGAAFGAKVDRLRDRDTGQEVQRCRDVASTTPQYWDVTYNFRGVEHRVQWLRDRVQVAAPNVQRVQALLKLGESAAFGASWRLLLG